MKPGLYSSIALLSICLSLGDVRSVRANERTVDHGTPEVLPVCVPVATEEIGHDDPLHLLPFPVRRTDVKQNQIVALPEDWQHSGDVAHSAFLLIAHL